jgi:hypothetical protein
VLASTASVGGSRYIRQHTSAYALGKRHIAAFSRTDRCVLESEATSASGLGATSASGLGAKPVESEATAASGLGAKRLGRASAHIEGGLGRGDVEGGGFSPLDRIVLATTTNRCSDYLLLFFTFTKKKYKY